MPNGIASTERQAELLKDKGNLYFKKERLGAAIEAYTEAITLCPDVPIYWTNRALCHRKRNEWEQVEADCKKALELDKSSVKAHYMLGLALLQSKHYGEAVKQLEKALELGRGGKPAGYMVEEIWQELAKARFTEWEQVAGPRQQKQTELREFCAKAVQEAYEKAISKLEEVDLIDTSLSSDGIEENTAVANDDMHNTPIQVDADPDGDSEGHVSAKISRLTHAYRSQRQILCEVFEKASERDSPGEVPDYLCCKITMDIFRDPVITPSGVTYERALLLEHLQKVGKFDPLTRAPLQPDQLIPNLAIKEAVQSYLEEHGWAYKMT